MEDSSDATNSRNKSVFEYAVHATVNGDSHALKTLITQNPDLVKARSERDHHATLLHYIAANGVEDENQKTPQNAVEITKILLDAGSEVDALADVYGGQHTTMSLLVSSCHPAKAGVQVELVNTLLDYGAQLEGFGSGNWVSPLMSTLAFGYLSVAKNLVERGAKVNNVATAAGLGLVEETNRLYTKADSESRHRALVLAAQMGHTEVVRLLLDLGEDPNRYNPYGNHAHSTPLHQAAIEGHLDVVKLLTELGARIDLKDKLWDGTPLDWAVYADKKEVADFLNSLESEIPD